MQGRVSATMWHEGTEFAGGQGVEGAETTGKSERGQAPLTVEPTQKILCTLSPFCGNAIVDRRRKYDAKPP